MHEANLVRYSSMWKLQPDRAGGHPDTVSSKNNEGCCMLQMAVWQVQHTHQDLARPISASSLRQIKYVHRWHVKRHAESCAASLQLPRLVTYTLAKAYSKHKAPLGSITNTVPTPNIEPACLIK